MGVSAGSSSPIDNSATIIHIQGNMLESMLQVDQASDQLTVLPRRITLPQMAVGLDSYVI